MAWPAMVAGAAASGLGAWLSSRGEKKRAEKEEDTRIERFRQYIEAVKKMRAEGIDRGLKFQRGLMRQYGGQAERLATSRGITSAEGLQAFVTPAKQRAGDIGGRVLSQVISSYDEPLMRGHHDFANRDIVQVPTSEDVWGRFLQSAGGIGMEAGLAKMQGG